MFKLFNIAAFELCWIAVVWGAGSGQSWPGIGLMLAFVLTHIYFSPSQRADVSLAGVALGLGLLIDTLLIHTQLVAYASSGPMPALAPLWILALWLGFSQTLNHALSWLRGRPWLAMVFGAIGGPLSYWAAQRVFAAADFPNGWLAAMLALALAWGLITASLTQLANRFDQPVTATSNERRQRLD